ncbi:NAD(P)/FAD-dependent oxidoreductase [Pseudooceanicola aestuarii]|uniref:NAD(P)/FAD-dependent oxidoreductase n=1 Tax=Pseudooceanicola aestuarii TaxID=2697319 RepID=UPI0013D10C98|nr:FAD-binding oxidoreductase [Pseudooceanicola aestuarii]
MTSVDVTVRGAGILGLSCAWALVQRGARVRVIDPAGPGAGSSGGVVGALAPHVPENWNEKKAFQLDSLLSATAFWDGVETAGGQSAGYLRSGRLQPLADAAAVELARARCATAAELWQGRATWQVIAAAEAPGAWRPDSPSGFLVHDTMTARLHPRLACAALVAALAVRGVRVLGDGAEEGAVLHATGAPGLVELSRHAGRQIGVPIKGQAALLRHDAAALPQIFAGGVHVIPHVDGTTAIGSTSERDFASAAPDGLLDGVIAAARAAVPALRDAPVIERWAGMRPRARTRAPVLGHWPGRPGHFIANGGFKIGFGMAPGIAHAMAALLLEEDDSAIPAGFRVEPLFPTAT